MQDFFSTSLQFKWQYDSTIDNNSGCGISTAYEYAEQQRVVKSTRGNGRFSSTTWMCCGRLSETDEDGITTTYAYTYSPYGQVTATGNVTQPIQWSSEFNDEELGLVYYNWRYYNIGNGRWTNYDYFESINKYKFDSPGYMNDYLGLEMYVSYDTYFNIDHYNKYKKERREDLISKVAYTTIYDIINESYEKILFSLTMYMGVGP